MRPSPRPLRLIFVEDSLDDLELVARELRGGGLEPDSVRVEDAAGLRAALAAGEWDAVISDYRLPAFSAPAALAVVRESGRDLPFIVVTGTIGEDRAVELMRAGAHDFVLKDQLGRLPAAVERAIGDARVRSERTRALELLRSTNHELATLVEAAPLGVLVVDAGARVRGWNPAAARLLGWEAAEVLGGPVPALESGEPPGFAAMRAQVQLGRTYTAVETRLRRRDGSLVDVSLSMAPLGAGEGGGCLAIAEDITGRKRLEHMLLQSQKLEAIGLLAGGVAHDFNNLLGVILGYGENLLIRLEAGDPRRRAAQEVCKAAERATTLTGQLLAFSRKQVMCTRVADLNEVVRGMEGMLHRLIGEDIILGCALAPAPLPVLCDPAQIEVAIMNLAVNARDAMSSGGHLDLSTAAVEVAAGDPLAGEGVVPGSYVAVSVADTGTGMDAATRERIFEPFFTTKERGRGTGLGLSTVFGIVKQTGGHIVVASTPGQGTVFRVFLPRSESSAASEPGAAEAEAAGGAETILVVEDEEGLRQLIHEQLEAKGYRVLSAPDAESAFARLRQHDGGVDLLLTDVILPGLSGPQLAQRLQAERGALRVLYMSGYADEAIHRHGIPRGGTDLIEKPFRTPALLARIRQALATPLPG